MRNLSKRGYWLLKIKSDSFDWCKPSGLKALKDQSVWVAAKDRLYPQDVSEMPEMAKMWCLQNLSLTQLSGFLSIVSIDGLIEKWAEATFNSKLCEMCERDHIAKLEGLINNKGVDKFAKLKMLLFTKSIDNFARSRVDFDEYDYATSAENSMELVIKALNLDWSFASSEELDWMSMYMEKNGVNNIKDWPKRFFLNSDRCGLKFFEAKERMELMGPSWDRQRVKIPKKSI